jgi:tetratricopeptide (TPR) repeat protein
MSKRRLVVFGSFLALTLLAGDARAQMGVARGRVLDERSEPLSGVTIELEFLGGVNRRYQTTTDAKGSYIQTLPGGRYRITASLEGYRGAFVEYEVELFEGTSVPDLELTHRERAQQARMAPILDKFNEAGELTRTGKLDEAQALLEELAAEHPEISEVHFNLGTIHSQKREWEAAEAAFQRTLELKPDSVPAGMALSSVYESAGRVDDAIATRARVAEENPEDADVQYSLALLYLNAQKMEEAGTVLERVVRLAPDRADVHYLLGSVALNKGDLAAAIPHLERYLELASEDGQYRASVSQILPALRASLDAAPKQ